LKGALDAEGLSSFLDERELQPGDNWVLDLDGALGASRALVMVLTPTAVASGWVQAEWTSFMAKYGHSGRIIPVRLQDVVLSPLLASIQSINALDGDVARVAGEIAAQVGRLGELQEGDTRRLVFAQDLVFDLEMNGDRLVINDPAGNRREVTPPWRSDARFAAARIGFRSLTARPCENDADRADLNAHAAVLGDALFGVLFDAAGADRLKQATLPGGSRPLITLRSDDDSLLALPWELIRRQGDYLVRSGVVDLARATAGPVGENGSRRAPDGPFTLVVNVSAPEGGGLSYEAESYRITRALSGRCTLEPTELGTLEDLVATAARVRPTGIHFSGHGGPGTLLFEDDEGDQDPVPLTKLVERLRKAMPDGQLPPFFYLANCHGNSPGLAADAPGLRSLAAGLHRAGVGQVVGYFGPISDELSTQAEVALYTAIADGHPTTHALRQARAALDHPTGEQAHVLHDALPFAWSQLVFYHRGPDHPLSLPPKSLDARAREDDLRRTYVDIDRRRVLATGFIGRRTELHRIRKRLRRGDRVFVLQGLGGLGKTTLAFHMLPLLGPADARLTLWCQDAEKATGGADPIAEALVGQLLEYCRSRFGLDWEGVVQQVDRAAGDDSARRFAYFLQSLLANVPRLVVYLDNLESLLVGPDEAHGAGDGTEFGEWRSPGLKAIWSGLVQFARASDRLAVVASCRYRHDDFGRALFTVSPLPPDALYRLMAWFPALRQLSGPARARLVARLAGHPRAVEYADNLLDDALTRYDEDHGHEWRPLSPDASPADLDREWSSLVEPALPAVTDLLRENLLFDALWDRVLDDPARRMLYRMTLLRQPWDRDLMNQLGDPAAPPAATVKRLLRTSLL
jgi:hypothetical protein